MKYQGNNNDNNGKSSLTVQCAMLKACDACANTFLYCRKVVSSARQ